MNMAIEMYWADNYVKKKKTAYEAIGLIRPGQRVFTGASCGEPQALLRVLADEFHNFPDLEVVRLLSLESTPLTLIANKSTDRSMNIRSFYAGSANPRACPKCQIYYTYQSVCGTSSFQKPVVAYQCGADTGFPA
jgi:acyl-CoA hydrolase